MPTHYRYKIRIAYDGTLYSGWQIQPHSPSIQQCITEALRCVLRNDTITIIGSGRTDAGVHALGQVAHFTIPTLLDERRFLRSMNGLLPEDIRILSVEQVDLNFHAQKSAISKIYHYTICLMPYLLPLDRNCVTHVRQQLNIALLTQAAQLFVGTHDFSAFSNSQHTGACAKNPVRTIYSIQVIPTSQGIRLEFHGNGFLYKMVRNIVGMLLDVASGKKVIEDIVTTLQSKDRKKAAKAAPAKGLTLAQVIYTEST